MPYNNTEVDRTFQVHALLAQISMKEFLKNKKINSWVWKRPVGSHVTCGMWRNKPCFSIFLVQVEKKKKKNFTVNITLLVQVNETDRN